MGRQSAPTEPVSGSDVRMHGLAPAAQPSSASSNGLGRERSLCTTTAGPRDGARSKVFYRRRGDRAVQIGLLRHRCGCREGNVGWIGPNGGGILADSVRTKRRSHFS